MPCEPVSGCPEWPTTARPWLRLCNERRVELAFEEHRFFDVRRWTAPGGDLSKTDRRVTGMRIEESNGQKTYTRFSFDRQSYTSKFLKYPVSLDEVRKMLSLTGRQNDGWNDITTIIINLNQKSYDYEKETEISCNGSDGRRNVYRLRRGRR